MTDAPKVQPDSGQSSKLDIVPLEHEPWIRLADGEELASWSKQEEIIYNQRNRQAEKYLFFRRIFDFLTENEIHGDYHEFGCHRARTFRMALTEARRHNLDSMKFWAFDSFEGLPMPVTLDTYGRDLQLQSVANGFGIGLMPLPLLLSASINSCSGERG